MSDRGRRGYGIGMKRAGEIISYLHRPGFEDLSNDELARAIDVPEYDVRRAKMAFKWGYTVKLNLCQIRLDGGIQPRAELDPKVIAEYAEQMKEGRTTFPPIVVYYDGQDYWLAEGFHRVQAAIKAGFKKIPAEVKMGDRRDAALAAVGSNALHGLRRTQADKRRVVARLLEDKEWSAAMSSRDIATRCKVSHTFVDKLRKELHLPNGNVAIGRPRVGADGRVIKTAETDRKKTATDDQETGYDDPPETNEHESEENGTGTASFEALASRRSESAPPVTGTKVSRNGPVVTASSSSNGVHSTVSDPSAPVEHDPQPECGTEPDGDETTAEPATGEQVRHQCPTCNGLGYILRDAGTATATN